MYAQIKNAAKAALNNEINPRFERTGDFCRLWHICLVDQLKTRNGVTEQLKAADQMKWVSQSFGEQQNYSNLRANMICYIIH